MRGSERGERGLVSLLFFNVGVEVGQLLFIGALILLLRIVLFLWKATSRRPDFPALWQPTAAYLIGTVATFWTIERVMGFWPA